MIEHERKECHMFKLIKILVKIVLVIIVIISLSVVYTFKLEPYRITKNQYFLGNKTNEVLKIVQFSDTHIKKDFTVKNLEKAVDLINQQNANIVVFTGNLCDNYAPYKDDENLIIQLNRIEAKLAKIAIWGNRDYGGGAVRQYQNIMSQSGFTLLKNQHHFLNLENGNTILLTGFDDGLLGSTTNKLPPSRHADYKILLAHEQNIAKAYEDYNYDLSLSGDSHGGQIDISFLANINQQALEYSKLINAYKTGFNKLSDHQYVYVNRGIGTTHISARLGVVPEISIFNIYLP